MVIEGRMKCVEYERVKKRQKSIAVLAWKGSHNHFRRAMDRASIDTTAAA